MNLIQPLASGFSDAPSGSAVIYRHGTTAAATVYSDYDGTTTVTTHTLNSGGAVVRYVNEVVDVTVYNAAGTSVRSFVAGSGALNTEVRNAGYTGTNPAGASGYGYRTNVDTVLTNLASSLGGHDGKVAVGGVEYNIKDYLAVTSSVFNVKIPTYGAIGDGTADDTAAIQAAITAAVAAGGGEIFFPPGTYKLSSALTFSTAKLKFTGGGSKGAAILKQSGAALNWFTISFGGNNAIFQNLTFSPVTTGNSGWCIATATNHTVNDLTVRDCIFNVPTTYAISVGTGGTFTRIKIVDCHFSLAEAGGKLCDVALTGSGVVSACSAAITVDVSGLIAGGSMTVVGCDFDSSKANTTFVLVDGEAFTVSGCRVRTGGAGSNTLTLAKNANSIIDSGNNLLGNATTFALFTPDATGLSSAVVSDSFAGKQTSASNVASAATVTPNPRTAGIWFASMVNTATAVTIANPPSSWTGAKIVLYLVQTNAGAALTITWGGHYKGGPATISASTRAAFTFLYMGSDIWALSTGDTTAGYA